MLGKRLFSIFCVLLIIFIGSFWFNPQKAQALGVSPPWVKSDRLLRGSHFEQIVYINQGDPKESLLAKAQINVPEEIKDWISINPGMEFTIPITRLFPLTVIVDIPQNAKLGRYAGEIKITTFPETKGAGQVAIGVGLAIALDFTVTDQALIDYEVAAWKIAPMEDRWPLKIAFILDNKGNARVRPQKVVARLEGRGTPSLGPFEIEDWDYVGPFQRGEIMAEFPIKLAEGPYSIKLQFYKTESEILEFKTSFDVLSKGTLPRPPKPWWFWASIGFGTALAVVLTLAAIKFRLKIMRIFAKISAPFINIKRKFGKIMRVLKEKE